MALSPWCNIVTHNRPLAQTLAGQVRAMGGRADTYRSEAVGGVPKEAMDADLWLVQAVAHGWKLHNSGYHLGRYLARARKRCLLLFTIVKPLSMPDSGPCWQTLNCHFDLQQAVAEILAREPATESDYDLLEGYWPELGPRTVCHG